MPSSLAAIVYIALMLWLFRRDFRERPNVTAALWLPFFWVMIGGSMTVTGWLTICGLNLGGVSVEEGSPIDATIFFMLIVGGLYVLNRRRVNWSEFMHRNRWVTIYLGYCLLATVWSDFPFVSLKRWIKLFGQPVMALVILTEPDPIESLTRLLKRFAYVLVPISILFIKYFPQWGRTFDDWTGMPSNIGITTSKNALGCDCFILILFFIWHFRRARRMEAGTSRRNELALCLVFFAAAGWLLQMAHSATSVGALVVGTVLILFLGLKMVDRRRLGMYLVAGVAGFVLLESFFDIYAYSIESLGRNPTLTDRTVIWHILLNWNINPVLGTGFESFWLGDRPHQFQEIFHGIAINQAHNGYLETYIQLGLTGVIITLALLAATYFKAHRALLEESDFGRFRLAFLAAFIVYNWTEAAFRTYCFPFFIFFLVAIDFNVWPKPEPADAGMNEIEE